MARGKPEIDRELCTGCKKCISVCPQNILKLADSPIKENVYPAICFDESRCIACSECAKVCPEYAIRIWSFSITAGG